MIEKCGLTLRQDLVFTWKPLGSPEVCSLGQYIVLIQMKLILCFSLGRKKECWKFSQIK